MYDVLNALLSDKKGGLVFECFDLWHIGFLLCVVLAAVFLSLYLRKRNDTQRSKVINAVINIAFGLYVLDFFLMPFAFEQIYIEKLPFHVCTAMCVMCFLSRYNSFLAKFRLQFAALGFLSNLVYLCYPAGIMWHEIHPLSYRAVQTLTFHGVMMVYGLLVLLYEREEFSWRKCYKDLLVVCAMTVWALLGNTLYNNQEAVYNWFFVVQDPFSAFSLDISPYIMPFLNVTVFFAVEMLVYFIVTRCKKKS